jgi:hypothetical protein
MKSSSGSVWMLLSVSTYIGQPEADFNPLPADFPRVVLPHHRGGGGGGFWGWV